MKTIEEIASEDVPFTYPDILFWFSKKDCADNMGQIKKIWDKTPQQTTNRSTLDLFLRKYAEEIVDKSEKYKNLIERLKQIELIQDRTTKCLQEKDCVTLEMMEQEKEISANSLKQQKEYRHIQFNIGHIDEFNVIEFQNDSKPYNYYIEFSYLSELQRIKGNLETFAMRLSFNQQFMMELPFDIGNLQINLVREWGQEQIILASRNLDPFTNLTQDQIPYKLKVKQNENSFLTLNMQVSSDENITQFLLNRSEFLQQKYTQAFKKCHLYKTKLRILLQPFELVKFDETGIYLMKIKQKNSKTSCTTCSIQ